MRAALTIGPLAMALLLGADAARGDAELDARAAFGRGARIAVAPETGALVELGRIAVAPPAGSREPIAAARWFAGTHSGLLGLDLLGLELGRARVYHHLSQRMVELEVERHDLPVWFSRVVIQLDGQGSVRRAVAHLPRTRDVPQEHPPGSLDAALEWAASRQLRSSAPRAGWLVARDGQLSPVVRVDVRRDGEQLPTAVFLDAKTMRAVHVEPLVDSVRPPGAVLVENPVTTPVPTMVGLDHLDDLHQLRLNGDYAHVERCIDPLGCQQTAPSAFPDNRGHLIFAPDLDPYSFDDPFAEVNAYYQITKINHWARQEFGWNGEFDGHTWIWVKVGLAVYNAYFFQGNDEIPPQITFGQDTVDFAYDADVAFHEFGHAINRTMWSHPWFFADRFGMDTSPFGIEEGLADIWAETLAGDPVMNTYIVRGRTADNDLTCPDDLRAEGHMEARIVSGFGWDVRERVGREAWEHAVYRTVVFLEPQPALDDLVQALRIAAEDLAAEGEIAIPDDMDDALVEEADARGLTNAACRDRLVPLPENESALVYGYGRDRTAGHDFPFGLQWKIEAPAGAVAFKIIFEWAYPEEIDPGYRVHVSRGEPVEITWYPVSDLEDGEPGFAGLADLTLSGAPEHVSFPFIGLDPLAPGEEVYVLLSGDTDEPTVVLRAEVHFLPSLPPPPGRPLGTEPVRSDSRAASWSPSCRASGAGVAAPRRAGLLAVIGALID